MQKEAILTQSVEVGTLITTLKDCVTSTVLGRCLPAYKEQNPLMLCLQKRPAYVIHQRLTAVPVGWEVPTEHHQRWRQHNHMPYFKSKYGKNPFCSGAKSSWSFAGLFRHQHII